MHPFRQAVEARDAAAMESLLSDDVVFTSPVAFKPYPGKPITAAILRAHPELSPVLVCSDRFHQARCVMLLRACGVAARAAPMANERTTMRWQLWLFYRLRELAALPYDALMIALRRR